MFNEILATQSAGEINWCAVIVSVFLVACAAIVYATREVDKCFDQYFDEIEGQD